MSDRSRTAADVAEAVRAACTEAAIRAYEDAGIRGLCPDGRWEAAVAAMRQLDLSHHLTTAVDGSDVRDSAGR